MHIPENILQLDDKVLSRRREWVSDCCLTPSEQYLSCIMMRISDISMRWWGCLLYTRPTYVVGFPDSEPSSLCSYSVMLHALWRSGRYQFYSFCLYLTRTRTHNLPHSRWTRKPLHHRCCCCVTIDNIELKKNYH